MLARCEWNVPNQAQLVCVSLACFFAVVLLWCVASDGNQSCFHTQLVKGVYNGGS